MNLRKTLFLNFILMNLGSFTFAHEFDCKVFDAALKMAENNSKIETVRSMLYNEMKACSGVETLFDDVGEGGGQNFVERKDSLGKAFRSTAGSLEAFDFWGKAFDVFINEMKKTDSNYFPAFNEEHSMPLTWAGEYKGEKMVVVGLFEEAGDNAYLFKVGDLKPVLHIHTN